MAAKEIKPQFNRISSFVLFAAIASAPLPFGSADPALTALWCLVLGVGVLTASPRGLRGGHFALLAGVGLLVVLYGFVLHEQLAEAPWIARPHSIWAKTSEVLAIPVKPIVSIVRDEPFFALGAPLANILALIYGLVVGADRDRARQMLLVVAWAGAAYAVYGILALMFQPTMILWREHPSPGSLTSTFINRNTAAAYFGSCAVVWLLLFLEKIRARPAKEPDDWARGPDPILSDQDRVEKDGAVDVVLRFSMLFVCIAALLLTGSRGGVIVSLLVLVITFAVFFRRDLPSGRALILALAGAGVAAVIMVQIMGNILSRIDEQGFVDEGRLEAYRSTWRMIADHPWFGTGLGTYPWNFPAYRSGNVSVERVWDIAHSTPLELAAELGLPMAGAIAMAWFIALLVLMRGIAIRQRDRAIPLAAFAVASLGLLHSCIDFSLQIPGYSIVVFALVGVGLARSLASNEIRRSSSSDSNGADMPGADDIGRRTSNALF